MTHVIVLSMVFGFLVGVILMSCFHVGAAGE